VTIRTTSDGEGRPLDIVTGMGLNPELALSALKKEARTQVENVAAGYRASIYHPVTASEDADWRLEDLGKPQEWRFEVVDVRLAPALVEGGESGWLAYGTLLSVRKQPPR
jgi:hypothetical protein